MLSSTQTLAPKPALPPAAPQAALPAPGVTGGPSFAQFMTEASPPAPPAEHGNDGTEADAPEPVQAAARPPQTRKPAATPAPAKPAGAEAKPAALDKAADKDRAGASTETPEDAPADKDGLDELTQLIGLAPGQPAPAPLTADAASAASGAPRGSRAAGKDGDLGADRPAKADGDRLAELPGTAARAGDTPRGKPADLRADPLASGRDADVTQGTTAANTAAAAATPQAPAPDAALPNFAAVLAQALPTAAARPDAAPEASPPLQAPLHSPAFAPELGARVSLLAVDGVQQAELTLNPADMGPVSVQIVVDGSQAQVSFHAAQAETRQALEQSLPDLAAALQGQGLTLSGGGVFQQAPRDADHAREPGEHDDGRRGTRVGATGGSATGAAPGAQRRTVGLLDTFA